MGARVRGPVVLLAAAAALFPLSVCALVLGGLTLVALPLLSLAVGFFGAPGGQTLRARESQIYAGQFLVVAAMGTVPFWIVVAAGLASASFGSGVGGLGWLLVKVLE